MCTSSCFFPLQSSPVGYGNNQLIQDSSSLQICNTDGDAPWARLREGRPEPGFGKVAANHIWERWKHQKAKHLEEAPHWGAAGAASRLRRRWGGPSPLANQAREHSTIQWGGGERQGWRPCWTIPQPGHTVASAYVRFR